MSSKTAISVPAPILSSAVFSAAPPVEGSDRPSGSGLTGNDIMLLWLILSHASDLERGTTTIPILQRDIGRLVGRIHADRLTASLKRLRGTDIMIRNGVMPAIVGFDSPGGDPKAWTVRIDTRLRSIVDEGKGLSIPLAAMQRLSSRYSVVLLGRFVAWKAKQYPQDRDITFGAHPRGRAFEMGIPLDLLPGIFGYHDDMLPSEIKKILVTASPRCPLKRELLDASVLVDTIPLVSELSQSRLFGLKIRISDIVTEGLADINQSIEHGRAQRKHGRRRALA